MHRMNDDRLPLMTFSGRIGGGTLRGHPPKPWIDYVWEDLSHLSQLHGVPETYINWWVKCKDRTAWTTDIHRL
jgi:hypothetical protein